MTAIDPAGVWLTRLLDQPDTLPPTSTPDTVLAQLADVNGSLVYLAATAHAPIDGLDRTTLVHAAQFAADAHHAAHQAATLPGSNGLTTASLVIAALVDALRNPTHRDFRRFDLAAALIERIRVQNRQSHATT